MANDMTRTIRCEKCRKSTRLRLDKDGYDKYRRGMPLDQSLPNLSAAHRILLMLNMCSPCFGKYL